MKKYTKYVQIPPTWLPVVFSVVAAVIVSLVVSQCNRITDIGVLRKLVHQENVYERVIRTGTIRCGYMAWAPAMIIDPDTKKMSGLFYDYMNEVGKTLNLKVEFVQQLNIADFPDALARKKIDVMCSGVAISAERGKYLDFTDPIFYSPSFLFAKVGDTRFDGDIKTANDARYTMGYIEGTFTAILRHHLFPQSKPLELPRVARSPELFMSLATGDSDFIMGDRYNFNEFNAKNPGMVRMVSSRPVMVSPRALAIHSGEDELRNMLNSANQQMQFSGVLEQILSRYEKYPGMYYRAKLPYRVPEEDKK